MITDQSRLECTLQKMDQRSVLRIILHLSGASVFGFGVYYFFIIDLPTLPGIKNDFAGKLKFLTTINAVRDDWTSRRGEEVYLSVHFN